MIKKKVGSITLAVGLITVGALLFAQNFMDIPVKDIYKYWPVLLIGLGLEMILYMVLYGRNKTEVKLSVDGLCIVFIIILGIISNGIKFIDINIPGRHFFGFNGSSLFEGFKYRTEISEKYSTVSYTHLRAHETVLDLVCRLLLAQKKLTQTKYLILSSESALWNLTSHTMPI